MGIPRKSRYLNEAIEALDQRLFAAKKEMPKGSLEDHTALAWSMLSPIELQFAASEIQQCATNRLYYLENYHTIQIESGAVTTLFPMWQHQYQVDEALEYELVHNGQGWIIVLKPRQAGITEYATGMMCWRTFYLPNAYNVTVAQDPDVAAHIQRKINITWNNLPWWQRPERLYHSKGEYMEFNRKDLAERSHNPGLGSVFVTTHAQRNTGVAIGRTVRNLHMTEVSRWPSGEVFSGDLEPSMNAPDTHAIAESTALGADGFFYNLWQEAMEGDSNWKPVFLPAYKATKFSLPLRPSQLPFELTEIEQSIRERVKTEENFHVTDEFFNWRRRRIKAAIKRTGYPYAHFESYPISPKEAFQSSGNCAFPRHKLDEQSQAYERRPLAFGEIIYTGKNSMPKLVIDRVTPDMQLEKREYRNRLWLWELPEANQAYYVAADVGDGNGGDFSVGEVMRAGAGNSPDVQVAEWVGWEQPQAFARVLYALGFLYNRCEISVEYAREGMTTANYLANDLEYPNLYRPRSRDRIGNQLANYLHWQTTSKTKPLIVARMSETLLENQIIIRSSYLLNEMYKFSRIGSGYGGLGAHDDSVMAAMIGLFCLRETMPELRALGDYAGDGSNTAPTRGARVSQGAFIFGLYDTFGRLIGQSSSRAKVQEFIDQPGHEYRKTWRVKPVPVSKANTAYSVVHHERSVENELLREHGIPSDEITPAMVSLYRGATGRPQGISVGEMENVLIGPRPAPKKPGPARTSVRLPALAADGAWMQEAMTGQMGMDSDLYAGY